MQFLRFYQFLVDVIIVMTFFVNIHSSVAVQADTVKAAHVAVPPVIDGMDADACWQTAGWQTIDQVWIPYGASVPANDYSGRYKAAWSSTKNVLYFLVEIIDDVFVDGYVYNSNPGAGGGYPNYDITEVFIDEDKSGGLHVFDGTGTTGAQWGTNAENAFSYHIAIKVPNEGVTTNNCVVCDIAGKSWSNYTIPNYASHLPEFAVKKNGNYYVWEFSLAVYNDRYTANNPEASRVTLNQGKIMGLSLAYCDNDDPNENPKTRDNFFGSVWVPAAAYNDHWMNADGFGTIMLVAEATSVEENAHNRPANWQVFPNPCSGLMQIAIDDSHTGNIRICVYNVLGQEVYSKQLVKYHGNLHTSILLQGLTNGVYFLSADLTGKKFIQKILILNDGL